MDQSFTSLSAKPLRDEAGRWLPGTPFAAQRKTLEGALRRAVHQSPEKLRRACDAVLDSAADGETWNERMAALTFIADRLDGKAVARIETSEGAPRDLGLAEIVALVLQHRKAEAIDSPVIDKTDDTSSI
jgi:hypothetical protein